MSKKGVLEGVARSEEIIHISHRRIKLLQSPFKRSEGLIPAGEPLVLQNGLELFLVDEAFCL